MRQHLTLEQKLQVQRYCAKHPTIQPRQLSEWVKGQFKVSLGRTTLYRIRNAPEGAFSGNPNRKRVRKTRFPAFDKALLDFFLSHQDHATLSDDLLLMTAEELRQEHGISESELSLSNGWLQSFKERHSIKSYTQHGESASVCETDLTLARSELQDTLTNYDPKDVFNFDETALFYRLPPNKTLATVKRNGKKLVKDRISIALCCNATGEEKLDMVVIGRSKTPVCFRGKAISSMKFDYYFNKKAWMTTQIFNEWLHKFNLKMSGRKVLLLLDNASSHKPLRHYGNVEIRFLPPNMTSRIQPLDAGIIRSFKSRYRKLFLRWSLDAIVAKIDRKINLLECVEFAVQSWTSVPSRVITNCWGHCRIMPASMTVQVVQQTDYVNHDKNIERELSDLLASLDIDVRVDELLSVEDNENEDDFVLLTDTEAIDSSSSESDSVAISSEEAMKCCLQLAAFVLQDGAVKEKAMVASLTEYVRKTSVQRKKQLTIVNFLCAE